MMIGFLYHDPSQKEKEFSINNNINISNSSKVTALALMGRGVITTFITNLPGQRLQLVGHGWT